MARMAKKLAVGELLSLRPAFDPMFIDDSYSIPSSLHVQSRVRFCAVPSKIKCGNTPRETIGSKGTG